MAAVKLAYDLHEPKDVDPGLCPVLMFHGLYMNKSLLNDMAKILCTATKRKIYCIDLRSHGDSPSPDECNCYLMAEDFYLFLQDHNIPKASFVCHSVSSRPGAVFAIDYPELVEKLVMIDFFPYADLDKKYNDFTNNVRIAIEKVADTIDMTRSTEEIKKELRRKLSENKQTAWVYSFLELLLTECAKDEKGEFGLKYDREATLKFFMEGRYRLPPYGSYTGSVLFLNAEKSAFFKHCVKSEAEIKKYFPKAECLTIPNATHLLPIENPEECAEAIQKYLES